MENIDVKLLEQKKKYLKRYRKTMSLISRLEDKLANIDERMFRIKSPNFSNEPKGGTPITLEELISDKVELEKRIDRLVKKSEILKSEILEKIDELDDPRYAEVLESFFIDLKDFEQIAENMGYTRRHVIRLYSQAIYSLSL